MTPPEGVDVIVGPSSIIVDGSYHSISGRVSGGRQMNWLNAPIDPECLEFPKSYPRSKGGSVELTLRVPVPASARAEGLRVYEHYRAKEKISLQNDSPSASTRVRPAVQAETVLEVGGLDQHLIGAITLATAALEGTPRHLQGGAGSSQPGQNLASFGARDRHPLCVTCHAA